MKPMIEQYLSLFNGAAASLQSPFLLLVRLYWGWQFMQTGWGKVNNLDKVTDFFVSLGIPFAAANAHFIAGLELAGGLLLVLGLAARPMSLMLTINMLVAYVVADWEAFTSFLSDPDKFTAAAPFTFLVASLIVLTFGAGKFSADYWIASRQASTQERVAPDAIPAV